VVIAIVGCSSPAGSARWSGPHFIGWRLCDRPGQRQSI